MAFGETHHFRAESVHRRLQGPALGGAVTAKGVRRGVRRSPVGMTRAGERMISTANASPTPSMLPMMAISSVVGMLSEDTTPR